MSTALSDNRQCFSTVSLMCINTEFFDNINVFVTIVIVLKKKKRLKNVDKGIKNYKVL